jgi:hypothetical protein
MGVEARYKGAHFIAIGPLSERHAARDRFPGIYPRPPHCNPEVEHRMNLDIAISREDSENRSLGCSSASFGAFATFRKPFFFHCLPG